MNHYASPKEDYTQDINESSAYLPKRRRNFKPKRVASMLASLVMVLGLAVGTVLVQDNQDIRQRAASNRLKPTIAPSPTLEPSFQVEDTFDRYAVHDTTLNKEIVTRSEKEDVFKYPELSPNKKEQIENPITRKVMVINFEPIIDGQAIWKYFNWDDPKILNQSVISDISSSSHQYLNYEIVEWIDVHDFPVKRDGYKYTANEYINCVSNVDNCYQPDLVDYYKILSDFNACSKRNEGKIHELWLWGGPYFGYWESTLYGPFRFKYNDGYIPGDPDFISECNEQLPVMGFNYEFTSALHSYGHRAEAVLKHLYGDQWAFDYGPPPPQTPTDLSEFDVFTARGFDPYTAGCGHIHGNLNKKVYTPPPPGYFWVYDYENLDYEESSCDDFYNYPSLTGTTKSINCNEWGCTESGFMKYWHYHLPVYSGSDTKGKWNNWWKYVVDFLGAYRSSPESCELMPSVSLQTPLDNEVLPNGTSYISLSAGPINYNSCKDYGLSREIYIRNVTAEEQFVKLCSYSPSGNEDSFNCLFSELVDNSHYEWKVIVSNFAYQAISETRSFKIGNPNPTSSIPSPTSIPTISYSAQAMAHCSNGLIPTQNTTLHVGVGTTASLPTTWSTHGPASGLHEIQVPTYNVNDEVYMYLQVSGQNTFLKPTWTRPDDDPFIDFYFNTAFNPDRWTAHWGRDLMASSPYVQFEPPAEWCQACHTISQVSPANGSTIGPNNATLTWQDCATAAAYRLQISGPGVNVTTAPRITNYQHIGGYAHQAGKTYQWRVRTCNDTNCSSMNPWSGWWTYKWQP